MSSICKLWLPSLRHIRLKPLHEKLTWGHRGVWQDETKNAESLETDCYCECLVSLEQIYSNEDVLVPDNERFSIFGISHAPETNPPDVIISHSSGLSYVAESLLAMRNACPQVSHLCLAKRAPQLTYFRWMSCGTKTGTGATIPRLCRMNGLQLLSRRRDSKLLLTGSIRSRGVQKCWSFSEILWRPPFSKSAQIAEASCFSRAADGGSMSTN
jgi:hypothetical protein